MMRFVKSLQPRGVFPCFPRVSLEDAYAVTAGREALTAGADEKLANEWAGGGPKSVLALIIVWDQFSRVLNRGDGKSFSNDDRAGKLAMDIVKAGGAAELTQHELLFLKMPLLHTETLEVQEWNASQPGGDSDHVQGHLGVIRRFGREQCNYYAT